MDEQQKLGIKCDVLSHKTVNAVSADAYHCTQVHMKLRPHAEIHSKNIQPLSNSKRQDKWATEEVYKATRKNRRDNCTIEEAKYKEKWNYKKK